MSEEPRYPYVHVDCSPEEVEEISYQLWELGALGVEERDATTLNRPEHPGVTLVASYETEDAAQRAIAELTSHPARLEFVVGDAWRDAYKAFFKVTRLGARLVIRPSWEPFEPGPADVVVTVDPGRAFGTGTHESTRLVMRELDARVAGGERVLDIGTGTGILSLAALKLGAASALCLDVEEDAIAVTRENAELNGLVAQVEASLTPVSEIAERFPIVVANIQATVLIPLAPIIAERVTAAGLLLLSGILRGQQDEVRAAYPAFELLAAPVEGEWIALVLKKAA